jgi:GNAT superfamily N-acetyltransferase
MTTPRPCTLLAGIAVEAGTPDDWTALAPLHYRSHAAGAVTGIWRMVWRGECAKSDDARPACATAGLPSRADAENAPLDSRPASPAVAHGRGHAARTPHCLVGVLVLSRSPLSLAARDRATGGRYRGAGQGRRAVGRLINAELRMISRVVIAPNWRGLGLASRIVAECLPRAGTPYVEALAAMGSLHPLFERAGMTAYPPAPSAAGERLLAALDAAGLTDAHRRSARALAAALDALPAGARAAAWAELTRWGRSYLGAKNHRTNRPSAGRLLELVCRCLGAPPVYYLWRGGMGPAEDPRCECATAGLPSRAAGDAFRLSARLGKPAVAHGEIIGAARNRPATST